MLSKTARPLVQQTLPTVGANIHTIAERFYAHMFEAHPELHDGVFNRGHHAEGSQPKSLALSVIVFAEALVTNPGRLPGRLLTRVAHKHASLGIRPEQYQIVHEHLMWAMRDVLGPLITPETLLAWDEVYWLMAYALINRERGLYSARGVTAERVWRRWRVAEKINETGDVVVFVMRRMDDRLVKTSLPGQYVTVQAPMPDGNRQPRQYSLIRADDGEHRYFAVKRDGEVSNFLHDHVQPGDELTLSIPYGDVVLDDSGRPVIFISAGIGVTPMAGMISHLVAAGSRLPVMLLHADTSEATFPLRRQIVDDLAHLPKSELHVWYEHGGPETLPVTSAHSGTLDLGEVPRPKRALYYLCGPLPFLEMVRGTLLERGVAPRDIQYEMFGPDLWQADTDA
ncbi:globin domain-containing protein [Actinoplanes sp. L3-i22]|uniref:globin domain-containing protein n=1 Tax=Actinoplanes sp. L3-i22 TaxID=2836373 RepID=UPI001C789DD5|nr:globin domain-containing protein [Actinoplanes sp. L3-i22]BCY08310.1 hemin transporter [Actinoplanes sp. L3-i22]